jgi:hypothetical protein
VLLTWTNPTDEDFHHLEISYSEGAGLITRLDNQAKTVTELLVPGLAYGTTYAFTVRTVDAAGNKSSGALVLAAISKVVDDLNLAQYITAPMADVLPDTRIILGTQYTGTVLWYSKTVSGTLAAITGNDGKFTVDKEYQVLAYLTPNAGYTFAGLTNDSFIYGGATAVTNALSGVVTITFPTLGRAWYVANYGNDTTGTGLSSESPLKTVGGNDGPAKGALKRIAEAMPMTNATIVVIGTSGDTKTVLIDNTSNIYPAITLRGMSPALPGTLTANKGGWIGTNRVLEITGGAAVTLGNDLTITGGGQQAYVQLGAGVYVHDNGIATPFTMNGGTITGNKAYKTGDGRGGGIFVTETSAFIMSGGVISDNFAYHTGGVAIYYNSIFTMSGGTITNNEAEHGGGGVRVLYNSTFTMSGGVISANKITEGYGGGIYSLDGSIIMNGGAITGNAALSCGGIDIAGTASFIMNAGTISGNTAIDFGGGVGVLDTASFIMRGGIIAGNIAAAQGGGVAVKGGTFKKQPETLDGASGIIYGNNGGANSNRTIAGDTLLINLGHAVYIAPEAGGPLTRELTVLPDQTLDSTDAANGGWAE